MWPVKSPPLVLKDWSSAKDHFVSTGKVVDHSIILQWNPIH